ncbi:penicillin-binding protein 1A [Kerstersia gyiorum]|uniref:penicillin-binding protein 1A n=1 Tax=Kerstersia gyiorum TaxID=206506 RepID=UPI00209D0FBE|nr:PBP1A family penicillin-binding protein [Kerstersia gyiorum]MCP1635454.1 penicillin-binding protein 1A [Kerstersia gyiorum]
MSKTATSKSPDKPRRKFSLGRFLMKTAVLCAGLGVAVALLVGLALALAWPNLPELHAMTDYRPRVPLRVYTADNVLIGEFGEERRNVLRIDEIPDVMKSAVLAAEDDNFYHHGGIDWRGVARAGLTNMLSMSKSQGASTITMQVARNFYLSSDKTYSRKFYELLLTFKIEANLTKDQILELYMNQIYLGHRSYGFAAAARTYFGKPLSEITTAEAAMLAGIPKAPSRINPIANLARATTRQHYVLNRMRQLGYITEAEYQTAMAQPIELRSMQGSRSGGYAVHGEYVAELARQLLFDIYQDDLYGRGLNVYTTVTSQEQEQAYRALRNGALDYTRRSRYPGPEAQLDLPEGLEDNSTAFDEFLDGVIEQYPDSDDLLTGVVLSASPTEIRVARNAAEIHTITDKKTLAIVARALSSTAKPEEQLRRGSVVHLHKNGDGWEVINMPAVQAAFVALSPDDGAIRAMVGGFDFDRGKFNRVTQAWRQPGSVFKPFIYAAALERGLTPGTQVSDQPFTLTAAQTGSRPWNPKNYGGGYEDMLTMRTGLYKSKNMVSIRILQAITPAYAQEYIARFGFDPARHPAVLPMALGAGAVTPLQLASAYSVFANGGYRVEPYLIQRVTDSEGKILMRANPAVAGDVQARVIDPRTAYVMDDLLRGVATSGTAARARAALHRNDVGGKTGTTNESHDAWFAGYTPHLTGIAWMGFDNPRSLGSRETGGGVAMPIWVSFMSQALKGKPESRLSKPDGLIFENGDIYFAEFPPGQSIASVGLPTPDTLGEFLMNLPTAEGEAIPIHADTNQPSMSNDELGQLLNRLERNN